MTTQAGPRLPRILDDVWEPPPRPSRLRVVLIATGSVLVIACVAAASIREAVRSTQPTQSFPSGKRYDLGYPSDSVESAGQRPSSARTAVQPLRIPAPRPAPRRPTPERRSPAFLSINSTPWAVVSVDGRVVGNTPQLRIRVTPGRHELVLARDGFETRRTWVNVQPGATTRITGIVLQAIGP